MRFRLFLFASAALFFYGSAAPAALAAEPRTTVLDVANVTEEATHLFSIGWERGDLSVTLIAPDGARIPQDDPPPGVRVAKGDRIIIFRVDNAAAGLWRAEFQEYDNGRVGVIVQKLFRPLRVENVRARQDGGDILVDFTLSGETGKSCEYDIYLTLDGNYLNGRLLKSGTAGVGEEVGASCPAQDVSSHGGWLVTVYAQCASGGFTDFHSAASAPFAYDNPDSPGQVREMTVTLTDLGIRAAWQPPEGEPVTGYLAVLYGPDGSLLHSVAVDAAHFEAMLPVDTEGAVRAGVSAVREPLCGLPVLVDVDTSLTFFSLVGFDLPDRPQAAGGYVELAYDTGSAPVRLSTSIDGRDDSLTISGGGVLRLPVHGGVNRVTLSAQAPSGVWVMQSRKWMLDLTPPTLRIFEDWDALVTSDESILMAGSAQDAATLTVNGRDAPMKPNGNFAAEVLLKPGINLITVAAGDAAGNTAVYEARVTRRNPTPSFPWWMAGALALSALAVAAYALSGGRRRRS